MLEEAGGIGALLLPLLRPPSTDIGMSDKGYEGSGDRYLDEGSLYIEGWETKPEGAAPLYQEGIEFNSRQRSTSKVDTY